jgi:Membrane protein involved in the export of O-antigen and teichoic acid
MSRVRIIAKNTSFLLISQIISYIFTFFITIYAARYFGAGTFGIWSIALSITGIFGIFADLGMSTLMVREVSRDLSLSDKFISNIILIKVILSILTLGLIIITVNIIGYPEIVKNVVYIVTVSVIMGSFSGILGAIFQANEKMEYISLSTILSSIVMLLGTAIMIFYNLNIIFFAFFNIISTGLVSAYILIKYVQKFSLPKLKIDFDFWKPLIKESWPFGITALSGMLYNYIDSIMLSILQGSEVVGWYSAAYRLMLILLFVPNAVNTAIFPVMSQFYASSKDSLKLMNEKYFKYMIILGVPLGVGVTILADKIILFIFGSGYTQSIVALQILIWTIVITFASAPFMQLLQSINKQLVITKISVISAVINVGLNLFLIPKFSYIGASLATFIAAVIAVMYVFSITYRIGYGISFKMVINDLFKVLFSTLIMSIFILYFKDLNLVLLSITATLLYFSSIYFVGCIDDVDIMLLKQLRR